MSDTQLAKSKVNPTCDQIFEAALLDEKLLEAVE